MVQAMKTRFTADRDGLAGLYDGGSVSKELRGTPAGIEAVRKGALEPRLKPASRPTQRGEAHKTYYGFVLPALINPLKVESGSTHAASFHQFP